MKTINGGEGRKSETHASMYLDWNLLSWSCKFRFFIVHNLGMVMQHHDQSYFDVVLLYHPDWSKIPILFSPTTILLHLFYYLLPKCFGGSIRLWIHSSPLMKDEEISPQNHLILHINTYPKLISSWICLFIMHEYQKTNENIENPPNRISQSWIWIRDP